MAVIWSMFRAGVSSMKIGAFCISLIGLAQLVQLAIIESPWPVRSLWPSTRDRAQSSRSPISRFAHFQADDRTGTP